MSFLKSSPFIIALPRKTAFLRAAHIFGTLLTFAEIGNKDFLFRKVRDKFQVIADIWVEVHKIERGR